MNYLDVRKFVYLILVALVFTSCFEDPMEEEIPAFSFEAAETETFESLTLDDLRQITTPLESLLSGSSSGRMANEISIDQLAELLEEALAGTTLIEVEDGEERGLEVWKVLLKLENGAYVEIVIVPELGKVLEIEGQVGPFDYDLSFGDGFVDLQPALDSALMAVGDGEILRWELELEEDNLWEYEVLIENPLGKWEVEINAADGTLIVIKERDDNIEEQDVPSESASSELELRALEIVPGSVLHSSFKEDRDAWEILVETESDHKVRLFLLDDGSLKYAEGLGGPFDYEFNPGGDFWNLAEIGDELVREFGEIEIHDWAFIHEDDSLSLYDIFLSSGEGKYYINMDAKSGEFLYVEKKDDGQLTITDEMRRIVSSVVEGEITEAYRDGYDGQELYAFQVQIGGNAWVKVYLIGENLEVLFVKGAGNPGETNVNPGEQYIDLQTAIEIALNTREGEVVEWKFNADDNFYRIDVVNVAGSESKVWMDATTGEVIEIEEETFYDLPEELRAIVGRWVSGEIVEFYIDSEDQDSSWVVKVKAEDEYLKFYMSFQGDLLYAYGEDGPFAYDFDISEEMISFQMALELLKENTDGILKEWELKVDDAGNFIFRMDVEIDGERVVIEIDAITGEVSD